MPKLWIFLPAFNEEQALPNLLPRIDETMREHGYDYEMVVVDDGSNDNTPAILAEFEGKLPLQVVRHVLNRGLGETERDGFEHVAMQCHPDDIVVRVEGDDTHGPQYILDLLAKLEQGYDVVNTSRFQPGGGQRGVSAYRGFISRAANMFMGFVFRIPGTRDYSCGFRAYRGKVLKDAVRVFGNNFIQLRGLGFTSTLETIVKLHLLGCRFAEVPFMLRYDLKLGPSKMVSSVTTVGYLLMGLLYWWPFGGWLDQYRGLAEAYREDPEAAVRRFEGRALPAPTAGKLAP
ncbi:MAG: glycosyltransferase family 2 protein [Vulcanimicrobiota bacterium]